MNINYRLKRIADFVQDNESIIDIGCDHAFLCIYLVKTKKNVKAIASDINKGPLSIASNNIEKHGLSDKIKTKLGDGLETIEEDINTVIISGMGGENISKIIENGKEKLKNVDKIIISPNNHFYIARKTITEIGYKIDKEIMVKHNKKIYPIIALTKGKKKYSLKELEYGPILMKNKSKEFIEYYEFIKKNILSYINNVDDESKNIAYKELKDINELLERV